MQTYDEASFKVLNKQPNLLLIDYFGSNKRSRFLDLDYGEFSAKFSDVLRGKSSHPERGKQNRISKTIKVINEKYNCDCVFQSPIIKQKIKNTFLEKYNVENPQQVPEIREKTKLSTIRIYNTDNVSKLQSIKDKKINTCRSNFNVDYPMQSSLVRQKSLNTSLVNYNTEYPTQSQIIKDKTKETCLEKYGADNVNKVPEFNRKAIVNKINSGHIINVNGLTLPEFILKNNIEFSHSRLVQLSREGVDLETIDFSKIKSSFGKSMVAEMWLNSIENNLNYSILKEYHISTTKYHADGYDPLTNTIYEFYGDYWHGNLNKFDPEKIHPLKNITYQELYDKTINRENKIKDLGYKFIYIWESDFVQSFSKSHQLYSKTKEHLQN